MEWIDRDNARTDEILASRSTHWLVGRTLLGVLMMGKGIALGMHATHVWQYVLAPILFAGGIVFAFESAKIILTRLKAGKN